jgi:hypothetical protein
MNTKGCETTLLYLAISGCILANMFLLMMIGEINRKKEDGKVISYFGFTPGKMVRIFKEYRSLYPNGKLHLLALASFGAAVICLIGVAVCLQAVG